MILSCYLHLYDSGQVHQLAQLHISPVTPGQRVHRRALLPFVLGQLTWSVLVFTVIVAAVFARTSSSPSVVGHNSILGARKSARMPAWNTLHCSTANTIVCVCVCVLLWQGCHCRARPGTRWSSSRCQVPPSPHRTRSPQVCTCETTGEQKRFQHPAIKFCCYTM